MVNLALSSLRTGLGGKSVVELGRDSAVAGKDGEEGELGEHGEFISFFFLGRGAWVCLCVFCFVLLIFTVEEKLVILHFGFCILYLVLVLSALILLPALLW